jgi:uncharacterized protein (TIGR03083 family)
MQFDDELAALLALDAIDALDRADAGSHLPDSHAALRRVGAALAEAAATPPPDDLRAHVLAAARARRPAGRPLDSVQPCPPAEGFARTIADFFGLLQSLTAQEWLLPSHEEHGRVRDLVAHLVGVERLSARWLDPDDDMPVILDHVAATRPVIEELADVDAPELADRWHEAVQAVAAAAAQGDPNRPVPFHDTQSDVTGFLVIRTFELWAHSMDISLATGRPMLELDDERMLTLSSRLMGVVPAALAYRGTAAPSGTVRFVLTGAAGGCYDVPLRMDETPSEPDVTIVTDALALCRVAARRLAPAELPATIDGDGALAQLVLADLDAFARD